MKSHFSSSSQMIEENLNLPLFVRLLEIESISGEEYKIRPLITEELTKLGFKYEIDSIGNISAVRGEAKVYPLLNAHMDIVDYYEYENDFDMVNTNSFYYKNITKHIPFNQLKSCFSCEECEYEEYCRSDRKGKKRNIICKYFSPNVLDVEVTSLIEILHNENQRSKRKRSKIPFKISIDNKGILKGDGSRILGGDDKCGIFIALEVARLLPHMPMKILFTVQEENGCIGIQHFIKHNADWFDDILYSLTIDRRDCGDLLWSQLGVRSCTNEFASFIAKLGIQLGIPVQIKDGSIADVIYIRDLVPNAVNMSAGYYNPHDLKEHIKISDVENIVKWVKSILINCK